MSQTYKIAFVPIDAFGHVTACLGLASNLRERGHNCVFVTNQNWVELIKKHGFENEIYVEEHKDGDKGSWNEAIIQFAQTLPLSSFEKLRQFEAPNWPQTIQDLKGLHYKVEEILNNTKPDAIVMDSFITIPAVLCAGVPWVQLNYGGPLNVFCDERLPPPFSGLPTNDKSLWKAFTDEAIDAYSQDWNSFNLWLKSIGAPPLQNRFNFIINSPFLNIYLNPEEIGYDDIAPQDSSKWCSVDSMMRSENEAQVFEIPDQLKNKPGKLIYLSMGTLCSSELNLMRRLVALLSKSKHRFIVSKGPLGDQLELSDNMWGQNSVPQLQILPMVDLVITHGGNNTVTESLYFGTPMIVLPVFADQYDNAQRITEKGLGIRLDAYYCTESQLKDAIEKLVNDSDLKERYQKISKRIKESDSREIAAKRVEDVIRQSKTGD